MSKEEGVDLGLIRAIALLVHDLKSPLAAIHGNAQYLVKSIHDEEATETALDIVEGARHMDRLIVNLLDVCRSEEGALHLRPTEVRLDLLVATVRKELVRRAERREQAIAVGAGLASVPAIHADADLVRRIIENLLDNALKYSPWKGVVSVDASADERGVTLVVSDEGEGVPREFKQSIFDGYVRLERDALKQLGASRGLGLAFCRIAAEAHGGTIRVRDNQPQGSVFRVWLPLRSVAPESAE